MRKLNVMFIILVAILGVIVVFQSFVIGRSLFRKIDEPIVSPNGQYVIYRMKQERPITVRDCQIFVVLDGQRRIYATEIYTFAASVEWVDNTNDFVVHSSDVGDNYYVYDPNIGWYLRGY